MQTIDLLETLNEHQRAAVTHVDGPLLTLAGPGSGKTRVVTHRVAYLLQQGIPDYNVLALTFTNKAAAEMRGRLATLMPNSNVWMGTFHGYCAKFLRIHARAIGLPESYSIYDPSDAKSAMKTAIEKADVELTHLNIDQIIREISALKSKLVTPDVVHGNASSSSEHILARVYPAYQAELLKNGAVDFDDLLLHTATLLRNFPDLRRELDAKHKYILVDEYQDTNFAQYVIIRALSIDYPNLNVTGDPDQSVYGWRGANIKNILSFEQDYPDVAIVRLETNYRSTPEILSLADSLIAHNTQRKEKQLIPTREGGASARLAVYTTDREEADHIAEQISNAILEGGRRASQFAILYRTNAHSRLLEQALISRGLAYQLIGGFRFYQRQEIKDLLAYLSLLNNPTDDVAFKRVINAPTRGFGKKTLETLEQLAVARGISMKAALEISIPLGALSAKATKNAKAFLKLYDELGSLAIGPIVELLQHLLKQTDYVNYLNKKRKDEADNSTEENINELLADAAQVDKQYPDGDGLEHFLEQVALLSDTDSWEANSERVTLMTLHSAKGLEFPTVFIIGVEQNVLPHIRSKDDPKQLEEERRLLFVGITRAMDTLQLSVAQRRGFGGSRLSVPSEFLMELPRSEMQLTDYTDRFSFPSNRANDWDDDFEHNDHSNSLRRRSRALGLEEDLDGAEVFDDDACQLPQDELAARLSNLVKAKKATTLSEVRTASDLMSTSNLSQNDGFIVGARVDHPDYGSGEIQSVDGRGMKRICRVQFNDEPSLKTFHMKNAKLRLATS
jgi:DNA helicase-2/ATP-dependent DNA helicase PcrA